MLNVCEIQGLPAISTQGEAAGRIRGVILDAAGAKAAYYVLEAEVWYEPPRLIRGQDVCAIGPDALVYSDSGTLPALWDCREAMQLLRTGALNEGTQVYTRAGRKLGQLESCWLDERGMLAGCRISGGTRVEKERIAAVTASLILVETEEVQAEPTPVSAGTAPAAEGVKERAMPKAADFLRGKRAGKDIVVRGRVLLHAGELIGDEAIAEAAREGCLAELTLNTQ